VPIGTARGPLRRKTERHEAPDELSFDRRSRERRSLARAVLDASRMINQTLLLIFGSFFATPPPAPVDLECAEFQARAYLLDLAWESCGLVGDEALVLLATAPIGCAPAERFVLAKRALDSADPGSALPRILLHQGLREHRSGARTLVNLVAQVDLLEHMVRRNLIRVGQREREAVRSLARKSDALIGRSSDAAVRALFSEYGTLAARILSDLPRVATSRHRAIFGEECSHLSCSPPRSPDRPGLNFACW
jgi:hypothetical protein